MQILYSCLRYTGRLFLECALFVVRCNNIRTSWGNQKEILNYKKMYIEEFAWGISLFLDALPPFSAFLLLSSFTSSPFPNDAYAEWPLDTYIAMGGTLCDDVMSNRSKICKSIIHYYSLFLLATLFSTYPWYCLAFSWTELHMLLRFCLIHMTIIVCFVFYI